MIHVIIQARMGSSRLPGKVMRKIEDKVVLQHVVDRVKLSKKINKVIIATSIKKEDNLIADYCLKNKILFFRGSETDVLERYYKTAKYFKSDIIIRITSDCPLIDAKYIDLMIDEYLKLNIPYLGPKYFGNHKFPDGFNCEIFSFNALKEAYLNGKEDEREHVTTYLIRNYLTHEFKYPLCKKYNVKLENLHLSLDTQEDFELITKIYSNLYLNNKYFGLEDVLSFLEKL